MNSKEIYTTILLLILGVLLVGALIKFVTRFWDFM